MMMHKQVLANVKTLVDSGIKDVVEILNQIPYVWTSDSCEGGNGEYAEICLCCGKAKRDYKASAELANELFKAACDNDCKLDIYLEWTRNTSYSPVIQLCFDKAESKQLSVAFSSVAALQRRSKEGNNGDK